MSLSLHKKNSIFHVEPDWAKREDISDYLKPLNLKLWLESDTVLLAKFGAFGPECKHGFMFDNFESLNVWQ